MELVIKKNFSSAQETLKRKLGCFYKNISILVLSAPYYEVIGYHLEEGAKNSLDFLNVTFSTIHLLGALEIPGAMAHAHQTNSSRYSGYVALGCVIRGETDHYDVVATQTAHGLMTLSIMHGLSIGNGILTVNTPEQAIQRAQMCKGNKGGWAACACLQSILSKEQLKIHD